MSSLKFQCSHLIKKWQKIYRRALGDKDFSLALSPIGINLKVMKYFLKLHNQQWMILHPSKNVVVCSRKNIKRRGVLKCHS